MADGVSLLIDNGIATLTISNPGRRNAFTWGMYDQLAGHLAALQGDERVRVAVIQGTPEDGFAAGTDIGQFADFTDGDDGLAYERRVGTVLSALAALPIPVIASVRGAAVGAGLAVALSCDLIIAERTAMFGVPIARTVGNVLPANVISLMLATLGEPTAKGMLLGGQLIPAEQLGNQGAVFAVVDDADLDDAVRTLASRVRRFAPLTLRSLKELIARRTQMTPLPPDEDLITLCYGSDDFHRGVAAFTSKTKPEWTGK